MQTAAPLHRVRFVDWSPSGITALDFAPPPAVASRAASEVDRASSDRSLLAIGRENGTIEICTWTQESPASVHQGGTNAKGWVVHTVLVSPRQSSIDNLCFVRSPVKDPNSLFSYGSSSSFSYGDTAGLTCLRLFSTSGGSVVTEHFLPPDLAFDFAGSHASQQLTRAQSAALQRAIRQRGKAGTTRSVSSNAGTIWSLKPSPLGRFLAIGCEGGETRILDVSEKDKFEHLDSSSEYFARSRSAPGSSDPARRERIGLVSRMEKTKGRVMTLSWGPPRRISGPSSANTKRKDVKGKGKMDEDESDDEGTQGSSSEDETSSSDSDEEEEEQWDESFLVAGTSSSTAVVWDVSSGRLLSRLAVFKLRNEQTIVWSSAVLADGTIVLGDSNGAVTFYDARTRIPLVTGTFKVHGDAADVLALCVGPDGKKVYSASVDQKVAEYTLVGSKSKGIKWTHTATRRLHAHDIRALAIEPSFDIAAASYARVTGGQSYMDSLPTRVPIMVSGGADFHIVMTPAAASNTPLPPSFSSNLSKKAKMASKTATTLGEINPISENEVVSFAETTQRKMAYVPATSRSSLLGGGSAVQLCASRRWIVVRRQDSVAIWALPHLPSATGGGSEDPQALGHASFQESDHLGLPPLPMNDADLQSRQQWRKVIEMEFKTRTPLVAVTVSPEGDFLAISDLYESKLFLLKHKESRSANGATTTTVEPRKISSFGHAFDNVRGLQGKGLPGGAPGASALTFTPDGKRLVLCSYSSAMIYLVDLPAGSTGACNIAASFDLHRRKHTPTVKGRQLAGKISARDESADEADQAGAENDGDDASSEEQTYAVIHHAKISPDGQWLLTMDSLRRAHIFSLDLLTHHRPLPSPSHLPTVVVFHPTDPSLVLMVLPTNRCTIVDVEKGSTVRSQSEKWLHHLERTIHRQVEKLRDPVVGAVWLPSVPGASDTRRDAHPLLLWGPNWLCTVRKTGDDPTASEMRVNGTGVNGIKRGLQADENMSDSESSSDGNEDEEESEKRRLNGHAGKLNGIGGQHEAGTARTYTSRLTLSYQSMLLADVIPATTTASQQSSTRNSAGSAGHEIVVVERPYFSLAASLPPAYYRGVKYGS